MNNKQLAIVKGHLVIDGTPARDLIQEHRTPLYVYLEQRIRENCQTILNLTRKYFKSEVFYSYKANFLPPICKIIGQEGLGAEVATEFEYSLALTNKINPKSIILSAPYKSRAFLERILADEIGLVLICQPEELIELTEFIRVDQIQNIGIRLRSPRPNKQIGISINEKIISDLINILERNENLILSTLQLHSGTQLDAQNFKDGIHSLLDVTNQFEQQGITISQLDFGGGFPEAGNLPEPELDELLILLFETLNDRGWQNTTCIFEPGRYIVGDAGLLLSQIISVFEVDNTPWIMLNTGTHHCPKFSNSKFRFEIIDRMSDPHNTPTSIAGCLPTDMDVFSKRYPFLQSMRKGDYLAIFNAGAYTFTWSTRFSYPYPPMILINKDEITSIETPLIRP
ncbi:MAG: hypothetical protein HWN65_02940 [Candidatus Helarchaeota archaeon]|nr:hypothetical protein [Candidatus Helarchaeota archaeon]